MDNKGVGMAVAVMTAWLEMAERVRNESTDPDPTFMVDVLRDYMEESTETRTDVVGGLVSLLWDAATCARKRDRHACPSHPSE